MANQAMAFIPICIIRPEKFRSQFKEVDLEKLNALIANHPKTSYTDRKNNLVAE